MYYAVVILLANLCNATVSIVSFHPNIFQNYPKTPFQEVFNNYYTFLNKYDKYDTKLKKVLKIHSLNSVNNSIIYIFCSNTYV